VWRQDFARESQRLATVRLGRNDERSRQEVGAVDERHTGGAQLVDDGLNAAAAILGGLRQNWSYEPGKLRRQ
jgi:hypothetical protein